MTSTVTPTSLDEFVGYMKVQEEIGDLNEQFNKDSRAGKRDEAKKKLRVIAYNHLVDVGTPGINPGTDTAETISEDYVNQGIAARVQMAAQDSARVFTSGLDEILNTVKTESLEELALTKEVAQKGPADYSELLSHYQNYLATRKAVDDYKKGQPIDPKNKQVIVSKGADKVKEEIKQRMKARGYSEDLQDRIAGIAAVAAREGHIEESYIKQGADKLLADTEKEYREYESKSGKKVVDYVKTSIRELAKGDTSEFETAKDLVYDAAKK